MHSRTRFDALLQLLPRARFNQLVDQFQADKHSKGFNSWSHLVAMCLVQLSPGNSLRGLESTYDAHRGRQYHLGVKPAKRATLSEANGKRDSGLFATLATELMTAAHRQARKEAKELLLFLDSSPIMLLGRGYDWAQETKSAHITGLKLHLVFAPRTGVPCRAEMGPAHVNDITWAQGLTLEKQAIYVFDRGYYDYSWWHKIDQCGSHFVTRFKNDAAVDLVESRSLEGCDASILADELVTFRHRKPGAGRAPSTYYGQPIRRIRLRKPDGAEWLLATNDLNRPAQEIADLYRQRWGIELFFKWVKQRLKIKRFVGRSENAVKIQIYVALIVYLLLHRYRERGSHTEEFYLWLTKLQTTLFHRADCPYEHRKRRELRYRQALDRQVEIPM